MLQKVIVVLVGLVMSLVGALSPDALFASNDAAGSHVSSDTTDELLATLRTTDGQAFARVSVLWVEVDGRRVTEDAWGTGEVDEIRFKVGVKEVDGMALAVGDKVVELHPTDIITVRMFRGDFSYRGLGTALASVQLQGSVKTTVLKEGTVTNRVVTSTGLDLDGVGAGRPSQPGDDEKVAYVVLTTGEKVDTVAVEDGGARLFTEEATVAAEAKSEPGNLLAKWVKLDNKLVREYTWGDGALKKLEFEPAEAVTRSVVLEFNGEVSEVATGERVVIEDFVGEYLIYTVSGGMMRVRLDGYAALFHTTTALPTPQIGGSDAPFANFNFTPVSPKTSDLVQFVDDTRDGNGMIVFRQWDFGDGTLMSPAEDPTHRFQTPGPYEVKLTVTDNDLQTSEITRTIIVRNTEPVPDFDFSPKVVSTQTTVAFTDASFDTDGRVASFLWDFGDGNTSTSRNPSYRYRGGGDYTVTLTTTDDLGASDSLSKVVIVRNAPPLAGFTFSRPDPQTQEMIQFVDNSTDSDGRIVRWNWSFGDGEFGSGSAPTHVYLRPGVFTVSLTAFDDDDDADTVSTNIIVQNRRPYADFVWSPDGQPANVAINFTSISSDPDGRVILHDWNFGDGSRAVRGVGASHTFPRAGAYNVTLIVTDNALGTSNVTRSVNVSNSAPRANFAANPTPAFRSAEVTFSDASVDPDGDAIVNWTWDMGDGATLYGRVVRHNYQSVGPKAVMLTVRDSEGTTATVSRTVHVLNRPPSVMADFTPVVPRTGENVSFSATGVDPDITGGALTFEWSFSDGVRLQGALVERNFSRAGNYTVVVRARDSDGGISQPIIMRIPVENARPSVAFNMTPDVPTRDVPITFTDLTVPAPDAAIREWRWSFGLSPTSTSSQRHPTFIYPVNGSFNVTLEVVDVYGMTNSTTREIYVNLPPEARFASPPGTLRLNTPLTFADDSIDPDGQVMAWRWEFGDGTVDLNRTPAAKAYALPGAYLVNLTVTDDKGTTDSERKTLSIENNAPVARWTYDSSSRPVERGVPLDFSGGALSFDPDGQPLANYSWTWGDGTPRTFTPDATHTFTRSGFRTVGLVVSDGDKDSVRTVDSHQTIRIGANHSVKLHVTAKLPGERVADLSSSNYTVRVRVSPGNAPPVDLPATAIVVNGTGLEVTVDRERWLDNWTATVRISASSIIDGFAEAPVTLQDGVLERNVRITLGMRMRGTIVPASGANSALVTLLGGSNNVSGDPLYGDMQEKPHGTGSLAYEDGTAAPREPAVVEARWVPLFALQGVRDAPQASTLNSNTIGWCQVAHPKTASDGTFTWTFDGSTPCVANAIAGGVYPVGRWEVRARPGNYPDHVSIPRVFYVDPTGGILMGAARGLA